MAIFSPQNADRERIRTCSETAYVIDDRGKKIAVIDTSTNAVVGHITTNLSPASPPRIAISPDGDTLYITDTDGNTVVVVSADTMTATTL
jgi:DNA-binding beta-propeller fold protein YncE